MALTLRLLINISPDGTIYAIYPDPEERMEYARIKTMGSFKWARDSYLQRTFLLGKSRSVQPRWQTFASERGKSFRYRGN
ncbi:MAG: hypothetical protein ABFS56_33060 [Pseudomonadota bacterium]